MPSGESVELIEQLKNRRWMERKLRSVRFVEWDRFTVGDWDGEQSVSVYGWIDREDEYKDFVVIIFWPETEKMYFITSSAKRSKELDRVLFNKENSDGHNECNRVEDTFNVSNAVSLDD